MDWIVWTWGLVVLVVCIGLVLVWRDARHTRRECDALFRRYMEGREEETRTGR